MCYLIPPFFPQFPLHSTWLLSAQNIVQEIKQYQKKWLQQVQRIDTNRVPRQALRYRPEGRRNVGRPKKRWRDQFHFED